MFHRAKKMMTLMACCRVLTKAPADATNEKGSPQLVAISWTAGFLWLASLRMFCIFFHNAGQRSCAFPLG